MFNIYNTPSRKKEDFIPIKDGYVGMYTCGPTVYDDAHIGNLRAYVTSDILRRVFEYGGYKVKHVINITDVGHLVSDGDEGEDKMTKALRREGKELSLENMRTVGEFYTDRFKKDLEKLNILLPEEMPKASEHIGEQLALIEKLDQKGYAYRTEDGVYFDTARFHGYVDFAHLDLRGMKEGARVEIHAQKRNPSDFALWKFNDKLGWDSAWGKGFPGWHIECSAMSMKYLGEHFDVHTGGIDHISIHHTNEIAQSECATGEPFANYWVHNEFVNMEGEKMAKSKGNIITLDTLTKCGISPISYRYWLLTAHYRTQITFSWEAVMSAQNAIVRLYEQFINLDTESGTVGPDHQKKFSDAVNDDLNTPKAIALVWDVLKDGSINDSDKRATLLEFDKVLGLSLEKPDNIIKNLLCTEVSHDDLPDEIRHKISEREEARRSKDWKRADSLRADIESGGFILSDDEKGLKIFKK